MGLPTLVVQPVFNWILSATLFSSRDRSRSPSSARSASVAPAGPVTVAAVAAGLVGLAAAPLVLVTVVVVVRGVGELVAAVTFSWTAGAAVEAATLHRST